MKKLMCSLSWVAMVGIGVGVNLEIDPVAAGADTTSAHVMHIERRLAWSEQHIRQLNHRRAYLHRYIKKLRNTAPTVPTTNSPIVTSSAPVSASGGWADELREVGFPESAIPHMLYIIDRESGGDPRAVNPSSGACGLTQLYPCYGGAAWLDPITNLRMALQKYRASGFAPWGG